MKRRNFRLALPVVALAFAACGDKEEPAPPPAPAPAVEAEAEPVVAEPEAEPEPEPVVAPAALSAEERAAKLGFARHLPADVEFVMSVYQGSRNMARIRDSKLVSTLGSAIPNPFMPGMQFEQDFEMQFDEDFEMPEAEQEPGLEFGAGDEEMDFEQMMADQPQPSDLFGLEFTVGLGKGAGEQTANLNTFGNRRTYFQMRMLASQVLGTLEDGAPADAAMSAMMAMSGQEVFGELLNDPESGLPLLEASSMPPLFLGFRTTEDRRDAAALMISQGVEFLGMTDELVEPIEVERAGATFLGYRVMGEGMATSIRESGENPFEGMLSPTDTERFLTAISDKDLVVLTGVLDEYVILFIGASEDDFQLQESADDSILAGDAFAFSDAYVAEELAAVLYANEESLERVVGSAGGLAEISRGLRDGLAMAEGMGDTRDLEILLQMVADSERALMQLATYEATGLVAYVNEGLRVETYGGVDDGSVDHSSPATLRHLAEGEHVVFFMNGVAEERYVELSRRYLESLVEALYALHLRVAALEIEGPEFQQYQEFSEMFDLTFREDAVALWGALGGQLGEGLGLESAIVLDLAGSVPPTLGLPAAVVEQGRWPRFTAVSPVRDREKVAESWNGINATSASLMAKISEMTGMELSMQRPIDSETDGFTTWSFSMPIFNDEFTPSVTLNDEWYAVSTSKVQSLDLLGRAASGGEAGPGALMTIDFNALREYAAETLALMEANSEELFAENPEFQAEFTENQGQVRMWIEAFEELDSLSVRSWRGDEGQRASFHFKTR